MPLIPRIGAGSVIPLRRVQPQDVGSGAGDIAYGNAAGELAGISAQIQVAEQTGNVARGLAEFSAGLDQARLALDQDPDHNGREQKFETVRAGLVKRFRDQITGSQFQAEFDTRSFSIGERQKLAVRQGVIARRVDIAHGDLLMGVASLVNQAGSTDSDVVRVGLLEQVNTLLDHGVAAGTLSATERAQAQIGYDRVLADIDRKRTSQQTADAIFASTNDPAERLKRARTELGNADPELLDRTMARLKDMNQEERIARVEAENAQQDALVGAAYDGKLRHEDLVGADISAGLRASLESIVASRETAGAAAIKTVPATYHMLHERFNDPRQREAAEATQLREFAHELSLEDYRRLEEEQFEPDPQATAINAKVNRQVSAFILPKATANDPKDKQRGIAYREAVDGALDRERVKLGRKTLTDPEIDGVLHGQLKEYVENGWFSREQRKFEFEIVPPADAERLRKKIQQSGKAAPTTEDIRDAYLDESGFSEVEP